MSEPSEEFRCRAEEIDAKLYEQVNKRGEPHLAISFEYQKLAVEYSHQAFQWPTYPNGGALAAIPPARAFFKLTLLGRTCGAWPGHSLEVWFSSCWRRAAPSSR